MLKNLTALVMIVLIPEFKVTPDAFELLTLNSFSGLVTVPDPVYVCATLPPKRRILGDVVPVKIPLLVKVAPLVLRVNALIFTVPELIVTLPEAVQFPPIVLVLAPVNESFA